jgi:hypothetical protein
MKSELDSFLAPYDANIQAIVRHAHRLLLESIPEVVETQDKENLGYSVGKGYADLIFVLSPHKQHVNLGFFDAYKLDDPDDLLEGTGKRHRHVKLKSETDLQNPSLLRLISVAIDLKFKG